MLRSVQHSTVCIAAAISECTASENLWGYKAQHVRHGRAQLEGQLHCEDLQTSDTPHSNDCSITDTLIQCTKHCRCQHRAVYDEFAYVWIACLLAAETARTITAVCFFQLGHSQYMGMQLGPSQYERNALEDTKRLVEQLKKNGTVDQLHSRVIVPNSSNMLANELHT